MKRPSFQFYPGDWLRSTDLRSCSIAARGLWIEMLALMHEGEPYGHLRVGKKAIDNTTLARMVGAPQELVDKLLSELEESRVFSRTASGIPYSRRMVRDENRRNICAEGGSKSLAHPNVAKPRYPPDHPNDYPTPPSSDPSAASAVASASANQKLLEKAKKNGKACAFGDCLKAGVKTHSTNGAGPWYCPEHYDDRQEPRHITELLNLPTDPGKGKFDD